jgi:hypothetical protein
MRDFMEEMLSAKNNYQVGLDSEKSRILPMHWIVFWPDTKLKVQSLLVLSLAPCTFFMYLLVIMTAVL